ncbi:hypothetical protein Bca4012_000094 [Brassica carinata]|uniref:Dof zinc finger protein n=2 Tax=Brassica TaxID=3705 RepID=A0A8S9NXI9_BRACR|nr:hypothetical protein F2Q69_00000094 [Brassica cretica]KAG2334987.1 hypothetical protein Bca52824_006167 [Brassica carinata]
MVFSSFPTYPDSSNWQQQHQPITSTVGFTGDNNISQQFLPHHPLPPQPQQTPPPLHHNGGGGGGPGGPGGSIRPGSMAERARIANIPMPETALKCPRCDSTNTKFCYFNNYSLTQPRHFCKACRRYWTRGGALRSVPVGGGCRRNKRTKNSSGGGGGGSSCSGNSKSQDSNTSSDQYHDRAMANNQMGPPPSSTSLSSLLSSYNAGLIPGHDHNNNNILGLGSSLPPLKLMPPLDFTDNFTLQYGTVSAPSYHVGGGSGGGGGAEALLTGFDQWRFPAPHHQLPLLGGLDSSSSSSGLYQFDHQNQTGMDPGYGLVTGSGQYRPKNIFHNLVSSSVSSAMVTATASQLASVKMEDSNNQLNMSRQLFGTEQQLWNIHGSAASAAAATTSSWSDVSNNFSSSSTSNI